MDKLSRYGHRQRMRNSYLAGDMENAPDHNLLELYLSLLIPQKDVKELAYDLINTFGSLDNVLNSSPEHLMKVNGVGEVTAVGLSMVKTLNKRCLKNKNSNTKISSNKDAIEYCRNWLMLESNEKFGVITLDGSGKIINQKILNSGSNNNVNVNIRAIIEQVFFDKAQAIIVTHNHPSSSSNPSAADINTTIKIRDALNNIGVYFVDHIIVGEKTCTSMRNNKDSSYIFFK